MNLSGYLAVGAVSLIVVALVAQADTFDLLITGGTLYDGSAAPGRAADVGVRGDRIAIVGSATGHDAGIVIDASGLAVAPGFIDVHNHTDRAITRAERRFNEGFVRQGVTTIVGGPDGELAPNQMRRIIKAVGEQGAGTNVALYVGHNGIRQKAMGRDQHREPTAKELDAMKSMVREGMELGALGLSTGLMYEPGLFSTTDEVAALAAEVKPFNGIYDTHDRDPAKEFISSAAECFEIGRRAGVPAKLGHLKAVGLHNEHLIKEIVKMIEAERAAGRNAVSDQYPYDGAATASIREIIVVPAEMSKAPGFKLDEALADPARKALIKEASEDGIGGGFAWLKATGYNCMRVTNAPDDPSLVGKYLSELATEWGADRFDVVVRLATMKSAVYMTLGAIKEHDVVELLIQPWNMIASDGEYADANSKGNNGHPRGTGTFPRVLGKYVREERVLTLEDAIRKMTWLPAEFVGLLDRGQIAEGMAADIVVFDPATITDRSTYEDPFALAEGVRDVLVNGKAVLRDGKLTGGSPGLYLKRQR